MRVLGAARSAASTRREPAAKASRARSKQGTRRRIRVGSSVTAYATACGLTPHGRPVVAEGLLQEPYVHDAMIEGQHRAYRRPTARPRSTARTNSPSVSL